MSAAVLSFADFFSIPVSGAIDRTTARTMTILIVAICVGAIFAALYNFYIRRVPGGVVRLLLSRGATSPETALTAEELGLLDKPFHLWELLRGVSLRHIVAAVTPESDGEDAPSSEEEQEEEGSADEADEEEADAEKREETSEPSIDAATRFYIPADKKARAEIRFDQKGNGVKALVITCALCVVLCLALFKLLPIVYTMIINFGK